MARSEADRLFLTSARLIANVCRQSLSLPRINELFITNGADRMWLTSDPFPDPSERVRRVYGWMFGIQRYAPSQVLAIAHGILRELSESNSIVQHDDRISAKNLIGRIERLTGMPASAQPQFRLDPRVLAVAQSRFVSGHYGDAVEKAVVALVDAVQAKAQPVDPALDGKALMEHTFSPRDPILRLSEKLAEQQGYMQLFAGFVSALRNPLAHAHDPSTDANEALESLMFVSLLFRFLDRSTKVK